MDKINEIIGQKNLVIDTLDSEILRSFIYKMISVSPNEIVYCIAGTKNYSDDEFKERRFEFIKTDPIVVGTYQTTDGLTKMNYRVVVI
jgi:site-specific DNA recombinase